MNYINNEQSVRLMMQKGFTDPLLDKESTKVERIKVEEGEIAGLDLAKINIGKVSFLTSWQTWQNVEGIFNSELKKLYAKEDTSKEREY
jgi:hypothetical protein